MGLTKSEIFTEEQNKLAGFAKVLGHPARIAIIQELISRETCICNDLVEEIGLAQPTISQHLREMKKIGLIKGKIEGTSVCYCLNEEIWNAIQVALFQLFTSKKGGDKCC